MLMEMQRCESASQLKTTPESTRDLWTSWKVVQDGEMPLKTLSIPKICGHSLPHRYMVAPKAVGAVLHA